MPNPPVLPDYLVEDEDVAAMPDFLEEVGGGMDSPLPEYLSEVSEDGTELPDFLEPVEESDTPIQPAPVTLSDADKAQIANIQLDPQERIDLLNKYPDDVFDPEKMQQNLLVETTTKRAQAYGDATGDYSILDDLGRDVAIGLNRFGQLLGRGLQWAGAEYSGKKMEDFYKEAEAEDVAGQSPEHRAAQEKRFLSDKEGEFFGDAWTSPRKVASAVLQSAPSMAVGMGGGMAVAKGLMQAGMSSGMAGIIGGAVGEGSVAGAEAAKTAQDVVRQAPEELLVQTPEYQEAYKSLPLKMPVSERKAQAREMVASQAAKQTGLFVGGSTAALGGPSGHFMGKLIGGEGGKRLVSSMGKGMLLEGLQEAPQSAVEQGAVNRLKQKFQDPNTGLLDDVGEAAVEGGITGAVMGAPFAGLAHQAGKAGAGQELPPAENKDVNPNRVVSPTGPDGVPDLYAGLRQAAAGAQQETPAVSESEGQLSGNSEQFTDFPQTPEDVGRLPEFLEPVEEQLSSDSLQLDSRTETEWNTPQTSGLHEKYADRNADISHITDRQAINEAALRDIRDDAARERISSLTRDRLLGDHGVVPFREIDDAMRELDREGIPYTYERTDGGNLGGLNAHHGDRHDAADEDIRKVWGEVLAEEVRRYGGIMGRDQGDEFKIVWPNLNVDEVTEIRADIEQQVRNRADALGLGAVTHPKAGYNNMPMGALYTSYGLVEGRPGQYRDVDRAADELQASMKRVQALEKARELGYNYNQETEQYEPRSIEQTSGPGRADYEGIPGEVGSVQESEDSGVRVEGAQDTGRNEPAEDRTADKDQAVDFSEDISGDKDSGTRYMLSKQKTEEKTDTPEFKRWFGKSKVVDESGKPLVVYHKTKGDFESFEDISSKGEGFHFGTSGQANMRAAGREERVLPVYLNIQKVIRKKDQPYGWKKAVKAAKSKRFDGIIYLNRYEGVPQERFQELYAKGYTQEKLDSISDSQFRKLVPEARDSYIVFNPEQIKSVFNRGTFDKSDPRILYSQKSQPRSASLSTSFEIQTHVDGLSKSWKNAPDIRVVQDESQLPGEVYQDIRRMGGFGSVRGVYHQGKVYLVANNLSSKEEVVETVFHEALRHHGMRLVLGDKYDSFMKNAALNTNVRKAMKILAEQYKLDMKDPADRVALADEAIAHLADRGWTGSLWNRIVAAFRKFLRSIGLKLKISDSEIRNLISRSSWAVRNGKRKPQYMFMESDIRERIMLRIEEIIDDLMGQGYNFADIARIATLQVKKEIQQEQEAGKVGTDITIPRDFTAQEFKEWFKDSVAVTEDGSPRVWFHGSPSGEITELRRGAGDLGIHLGTPGQAEAAFKNKAANTGRAGTPAVYPVYVSVQNPLRLPDGQWDVERVALRLLQENVGSPKVLGDLIERWRNYDPNSKTEDMQDELRDMLEAEGYDGIVYSNVYESNTETGLHDTADSLMVFRPEQIKSVFNVGSWDGSNPDIRYLQKESVQTEVEKGEQLRQKFIDEIFRLIHEDSTGSAAFGLRITDEQPAKVGDILSASYPWDDGEHIEGADDLGGTSVIGIEAEASKEEIEEALNLSGPFRDFIPYRTGSSGYWGDQVLLVRGDRYSRGMDEGEYVIVDPEVIGAWSYPKMNGLVGEGQTLYSRNLTPAQEAALSKIGQPNKPLTERVKDWYANARSQGMAHMRQGLVDQYHSFNLLDKEFKKETGFDEYEGQSYTLARMANSLGDVMYSMLHHGAPKWSEGWVTTDGRDNGLIQIFKPLGADLDLFMAYRVGVRAEKLKAEDRENLFTDDDIQALLALRPEDAAEAQKWDDIWAEYSSFRKNTLDFAQAAGLIDPEKRKVWEDSDHLPFYRVMENDKRKRGPLKRRGLANQNSGIRRLKGGTDNIGDPYANIIHNMAHLTEAAIKNHAANVAVQKMEALGYAYKPKNQAEMRRIDADKAAQKLRRALEDDAAVRKLTDAEKDTVLSLFWSKPPKGENVVSVMQNGKKLYYEIEDPLLLSSLASVNSEHLNFTGLKTMRFLKRLLTAGVTLDPGFRAANLARDTFAAWGVSKGKGFTPVWDSLRGAVKVWNENDDMVEMMAAGGSFASGWSWGGDPEDTARRIKREMKAHRVDQESVLDTPKKVLGFVKKAWDQWERVGSASENAARVQMFANVRKNGGSLLEAAYESKDVMDFSLRGDWKAMQFLIQTVPFLGARVQSLYKMTRAGNRMAYWVKGGSLAMASMLLYLWNRDDDRFKELEEWDKDTYYHFWIGDEHFRYPKPFEYGAMFSTIPERALEYFLQGQDDKDSKLLIDRLAFMMEQTLSLNPMPQGFKQGVEVWANKNFFTGRPIEGMSLKREMPGYRRKPWTSETMSEIGKGLGVSPKKLEHFYRGIFGPVGMYVLSASDVLARQTADYPNPPATKLEESPVVSRFYKGSGPARNTKYATKFYDFIQEVDQLAATIKSLRESGSREQAQKIFELERDKIRYKKYLSSVRRQIIGINNQVNRIYLDNKKSPEVKRKELDRLQARKNRILKQAYERVSKDFR